MDFLLQPSILLYFLIFFGQIIQVMASTVRIVLINRGERRRGAVIAILEIALWLLITGTVLVGFQNDIYRCIIYVFASALGIYLGSWLEDKMALGLCALNIIITEDHTSEDLVRVLRDSNFAVTVVSGEGQTGKRELLILYLKRKRVPEVVSIIRSFNENAVISVNDVRIINGGYIKKNTKKSLINLCFGGRHFNQR